MFPGRRRGYAPALRAWWSGVTRRPPVVVILIGPPGVGKGTQGVLLEEATGARHIATGDLLRTACRDGTELGREAQGYMDRGELVPDQLIVDLVREVLDGLDAQTGVIFDGFPRTIPQAEALAEVLAEAGRQVDRIVVLEADDEVLVKRLAGRRSCPGCGAVYNVYLNPPQQSGVCDHCGRELVHRTDDDPVTVRRRLSLYREETAPLVQFYERGRARVERVAADRSVAQVQKALRESVT